MSPVSQAQVDGFKETGNTPQMPWSNRQSKKQPWSLGRGCDVCGKPLFGRASRDKLRKRFCSYACAGAAAVLTRDRTVIPLKDLTCGICGTPFKSNASRARFCSDRCSKKSATRNMALRNASLDGHMIKLRARSGRKSLSQEYLMLLHSAQGGRCAISGVEMTWKVGRGHVATNMSLDRVDPKGGYIPGNVRLVCHIINLMRRDMPDEEFVSWCRVVADGMIPSIALVA